MQDLTEKARMEYLTQYKEKKQAGSMSVPRKSMLKPSLTSARIPPVKPKSDALIRPEPLKRGSVESIRPLNGTSTVSPKTLTAAPAKSATLKPISRKK